MKKINALVVAAVLLLGSLGIAGVAHAWWSVHARVDVNNTRVHAYVYNQWDRPIYCEGYAYGQTYWGHTLNSWGSGVIYPGRTGGVYVYTNPNNPFVNGWGDIRCRWQ